MILFYLLFSCVPLWVSMGIGCAKHDNKYACDYFSQCHWEKDKNECELKLRGLNSDNDNRLSSNTFEANVSFQVPKTGEA